MSSPTKLATAVAAAGAPAKPPAATRLAAALSGQRPWKPIVIPMLGVEAAFRLVGTTRTVELEAEVTAVMEARRLEQTMLTLTPWELERSMRLIAEAVIERDPDRQCDAPPFGSLAEWGQLPPAVVVELRRMYDDFAEEHDPSLVYVPPDERAEMAEAVKKKDPTSLRRFGAKKLAVWLTTTDGLLADSPTTKSSPGDSSPASSM